MKKKIDFFVINITQITFLIKKIQWSQRGKHGMWEIVDEGIKTCPCCNVAQDSLLPAQLTSVDIAGNNRSQSYGYYTHIMSSLCWRRSNGLTATSDQSRGLVVIENRSQRCCHGNRDVISLLNILNKHKKDFLKSILLK